MSFRLRSNSCILSALVAVGSLAAASAAAAEEVTIVVSASKDAMIFGEANNADTGNSSGKGPAMFAGADAGSRKKRGLVSFDVASAPIPANATIINVTLTMFLAQVAGSGGGAGGGASYPSRTLRVYTLQQDFGEGPSGTPTSPSVGGTGQGYTRQVGDSSWTYAFFSGVPWAAGGDIPATEIANAMFATPFVLNQPYSFTGPGLTSDVVTWRSGTTANTGWLVKSDLETSPTSFLGFWTKDGADANDNPALAPQLSITYTTPDVDPQPESDPGPDPEPAPDPNSAR